MALHPKRKSSRNSRVRPAGAEELPLTARLNPVTRDAAEEAVRTLLRWAGEDPRREGLLDTPRRVVDAYSDWFSGYAIDPGEYLSRTFEETSGYDEMVVLRDIEFESHCEHHMAPIIGRAHVGYLPTDRVVGISKLARVVDVYARRFQVQEKMTSEIARCIEEVLEPRGVAFRADLPAPGPRQPSATACERLPRRRSC